MRGEVVMPEAAFRAPERRARARGLPPAVNPRNSAAGTLRTLEPEHCRQSAAGLLRLFSAREGEYFAAGQTATLDALAALGFRVNPHRERVALGGGDDEVHRRCREPARFAGLRDRRRGAQGGCARHAAAAGLYGPRAALGHRLQVHRQVGRDAGQRHHRAGGPHRQADAGGRARRRFLSAAPP